MLRDYRHKRDVRAKLREAVEAGDARIIPGTEHLPPGRREYELTEQGRRKVKEGREAARLKEIRGY